MPAYVAHEGGVIARHIRGGLCVTRAVEVEVADAGAREVSQHLQGGLEGLRLNVGAQRGYEPLNCVLGARRLAQHGAILTPEGNKRLAPLPLSTSEIVASMARSAVCMASTASANTLCSYELVSTRVLSIADFAMIEVG